MRALISVDTNLDAEVTAATNTTEAHLFWLLAQCLQKMSRQTEHGTIENMLLRSGTGYNYQK
jgi:hypothetical protein